MTVNELLDKMRSCLHHKNEANMKLYTDTGNKEYLWRARAYSEAVIELQAIAREGGITDAV